MVNVLELKPRVLWPSKGTINIYNLLQNILNRVKKSSIIGQDQKTLLLDNF